MRSSAWWRRNRIWLALLLPLLALALAASSFRLTTLYLRWEWSQPVVLQGSGVYTQTYQDVQDVRRTRTVTVGVGQVARTTQLDDDRAAPGTQLWLVELDLAAAPDQMLAGCVIELEDAAGVRYGTFGAKVDGAGRPNTLPDRPHCVPQDAPGPELSWDGHPLPVTAQRPAAWRVAASVALPEGVEPTAVRVMWNKPGYVKVLIPR
ncbi:hypothetical protein G7070_01290 [Propioniciclava coleopterorum]|uniref:Uncharacterized protein n=1 Tax=Propioniciclava coleopterorum TaxID=2714937 RepID=A0A6G7Y3E4_9ACTN|nr:hypothetical protein [Propioniciclava coleopterorum]QIK71168.1 hypothetical protein G7070_01290 [Propioniciclava coleopterorum]